MKYIKLGKADKPGKPKRVKVDNEDYEYLSQFSWIYHEFINCFYAIRFVKRPDGTFQRLAMHRELLDAPEGTIVTHINHDTLDNRKANLEIVTHEQARRRQRATKVYAGKKVSCRYKGVSKFRKNQFQVHIRLEGKLIHLGIFDDPINAAKCYDRAARKYFGKYATTNFPTKAEIRRKTIK